MFAAAPGLTTVEIVGIAVGSVLFFILFALFIYCIVFCVQRGKQIQLEKKYEEEEETKIPKKSQYPANRPARPPPQGDRSSADGGTRPTSLSGMSSIRSPTDSHQSGGHTGRSSLKSPNMSESSRKSGNEVKFSQAGSVGSIPEETPPPSYHFPQDRGQ